MKTISFHKAVLYCTNCGKNRVKRLSIPCENCRTKSRKIETGVAKRVPSAVIRDDSGHEIFVDKFGKQVKDHRYDLKNDPRGWKVNGQIKNKSIIL